MVIVPPPMIVIPAASILARSARVASGGSVRGTCTSVNVMCRTPSALAISSARSNGNSRNEYEATPSVSAVELASPANAFVSDAPTVVQAAAEAAVAKNWRRVRSVIIRLSLACQENHDVLSFANLANSAFDPFSGSTPLERKTQSELNLAHVPRTANLTECRRRIERGTGIHEIDEVEDVGGLESELEHRPALQRNVPENPEINVANSRSINDVAAGVAVGADRRYGKCGDIEPALDQLFGRAVVIELGISDEIGPIVRQPVEVPVASCGDRQWRAALECRDRRHGPVARQDGGDRRGVAQIVGPPHS